MRVGIPSEIKNHEYRVAITPAGVHQLVTAGHDVLVQAGAGEGSAISDAEYASAGASIVATAEATWSGADLVCKVKEPVASEYGYLREDLVLFTYLHLPRTARAPMRCWRPARRPSRTRPCSSPTARSRCSRR